MKKLVTLFIALTLSAFACLTAMASETVTTKENRSFTLYISDSSQQTAGLFAELTKLPTPQNLTWHISVGTTNAVHGYAAWTQIPECGGSYIVKLYCDGEVVFNTSWSGLNRPNEDGFVTANLTEYFKKSGAYTFSVSAVGDNVTYSDGDTATSAPYNFVLPEASLSAPQNVRWSDFAVICHSPSDGAKGYVYSIIDAETGRKITSLSAESSFPDDDGFVREDISWLLDFLPMDSPNTKYLCFTVTAIPADIEAYRKSEPSAVSARLDISDAPSTVYKTLKDIVSRVRAEQITAENGRDELLSYMGENNMTAADLVSPLKLNAEFKANYAYLDSDYTQQFDMPVYADPAIGNVEFFEEQNIAMSDITFIGAALDSDGGDEVVVLVSEGTVQQDFRPADYENFISIGFDYSGVTLTNPLDFPIIVSFPVPEVASYGSRFAFIKTLDGSISVYYPEYSTKNGRLYAELYLTEECEVMFCTEKDEDSAVELMGVTNQNGELLTKSNLAQTQLVKVNAFLSGEYEKSAVLAVAFYDDSDRLIDIVYGTFTVKVGGWEYELELINPVPSASRVRAFAFNSVGKLSPLCDFYQWGIN